MVVPPCATRLCLSPNPHRPQCASGPRVLAAPASFTQVNRGELACAAFLALLMCVGCGDQAHPRQPPDATEDSSPSAFAATCTTETRLQAQAYLTASDFGPVTAGSLRSWIPNGRWFFTGQSPGRQANIAFAQRDDGRIVVNGIHVAERTDDALFFRYAADENFAVAIRVADQQADGTLRAHRAYCFEGRCQVCTFSLVRAGWPDGEAESRGLRKLAEFQGPNWEPGYTYNVRVDGNLAYVVRDDGMHIIDITHLESPSEIGHWPNGYTNDLKIVTTGPMKVAIIADSPSKVVDVTDPRQPRQIATITEAAHTVFTEVRDGRTFAYFGNYNAETPVYDISNPSQPQRLGSFATDGDVVHDLMVDNGIAYLNAWDAGFYRVDFRIPSAPRLLGHWRLTPTRTSHSSWTTMVDGRPIALHGGEAYGAHLSVVDLQENAPTYMQPIGAYRGRPWASIHNIMAAGKRAYVSHYQDGIRVFDLSDPTQPTLIGYFNTWQADAPGTSTELFEGAVGLDIDLQRRLIFVADSPRGLLILRDETP